MKQIKDADDITKGCPHTHMREPIMKMAFEIYAENNLNAVDLRMKDDAPHYSSKRTRIIFNQFRDQIYVL